MNGTTPEFPPELAVHALKTVFTAQSKGGKWAIAVEYQGGSFTIREFKHGKPIGAACNYTWPMLHSWLHDKFRFAALDDGVYYQITRNEISFCP